MKPEYSLGAKVRVRTGNPQGHCRTPVYLRGQPGIVERRIGDFRDPEKLAYGNPGLPKLTLYWVRFEQAQLWPGYSGSKRDTLCAEIYDNWLEAAE